MSIKQTKLTNFRKRQSIAPSGLEAACVLATCLTHRFPDWGLCISVRGEKNSRIDEPFDLLFQASSCRSAFFNQRCNAFWWDYRKAEFQESVFGMPAVRSSSHWHRSVERSQPALTCQSGEYVARQLMAVN